MRFFLSVFNERNHISRWIHSIDEIVSPENWLSLTVDDIAAAYAYLIPAIIINGDKYAQINYVEFISSNFIAVDPIAEPINLRGKLHIYLSISPFMRPFIAGIHYRTGWVPFFFLLINL